MTAREAELLNTWTFDARALAMRFPPVLRVPNKQALYRAVCSEPDHHEGDVIVTRWRAPPFADLAVPGTWSGTVAARSTWYEYPTDDASEHWHLNFASRSVFLAYGAAAFAQDEIQVAEHPILASIREAFLGEGHALCTSDESRVPTPVLFQNVQRLAAIATDRDFDAAWSAGLYGRRFVEAPAEVVVDAVTRIRPASRSNIVAIEAPANGRGCYELREIEYALVAISSAFQAVRACSPARAILHTGFWGCGAYGGDRILMTLVQLAAARVAGLDGIVVHARDRSGVDDVERAVTALATIVEVLDPHHEGIPLRDLADTLANMGFVWGDGDGN